MACLSWDLEEKNQKPLIDLISILKFLGTNGEQLWANIISRLTRDDSNRLTDLLR